MGADLGKMVGPLPLGAWVAVVGGGLGFMIYSRKQADVVPTDTAVAPSDPGNGSYNTVGDGSVGGWVPTQPVTGAAGDVAPTPTTNEDWGHAAINYLIAQGYDPSVSDSAIRKYLDQEAGYSSQEFALVRFALAHLGAPPSPLPAPIFGKPPVPVTPKPPTTRPPTTRPPVKGGTTKPRARHYTVRPGDTLSSIGRKFGVPWQHIYNANKSKIHNPNVIHAGWVLAIPAS